MADGKLLRVLALSCACATVPFSAATAEGGWTARVLEDQPVIPFAPQPATRPAISAQGWDARIDYRVDALTVEAPRNFAAGLWATVERPVFATVQRRFQGDGITPYIGFGAGYAAGLSKTPDRLLDRRIAVRGLFGTELALEDDLDVYVEYNFAVAPGARSATDRSLSAHGINTGLRLKLN